MNGNLLLIEQAKVVTGFAPAVPSSANPRWVSLKNYEKLTIVILVQNATTVTGAAIGLSQATNAAGAGAKTLPFTVAYRTEDAATTDLLTRFDVSGNSFTTLATNNRQLVYVIEVKPHDLDLAGGFDCVRVTIGNAVAATVGVVYLLAPARYGAMPSAIVN